MTGIFKFFVNGAKALIFSPFYLLYFVLYLLIAILNYLIGEIKQFFTKFSYGSKKENKYEVELKPYLEAENNDK